MAKICWMRLIRHLYAAKDQEEPTSASFPGASNASSSEKTSILSVICLPERLSIRMISLKCTNRCMPWVQIKGVFIHLWDKDDLLHTMLLILLCILHKQEPSIFCHFISSFSFMLSLYLSM